MPKTRIRNNSFLHPNMTRHYTVEITETTAKLKLTYRNGKFKRLEHLSGQINNQTIKEIGRIIPPKETDLEAFKQSFEGKITYTAEVKEKSLYTHFLETWYQFYERATGVAPKFTGADGKALKQIIAYLKQINGGNEPIALQNWQLILSKWETLKEFHQDNTDLKYINSRLNVIIREIIKNNGSDTSGANSNVSI